MIQLTQMPHNRDTCFTSRGITNRQPPTEREACNWFLATPDVVQTTNRPLGGLRLRANLVHSRPNDLLSTVFPFVHWRANYSGSAAIPKEEARRGLFSSPLPRRDLSERCLIASSTLRKPAERQRGTSPVEFMNHCLQVTSPHTCLASEGIRIHLTRSPPTGEDSCFVQRGETRTDGPADTTSPEVELSGLFVTTHCWIALAASPPSGGSDSPFCTSTDLHR